MTTTTTTTEERALKLLGDGISPQQTALALGITESRISQMLSQEEFAAQVAEARYKNAAKKNALDNRYDALEDNLLARLEDCIPMMHRPMEILKAIAVINAAKRRGAPAPASLQEKSQVINLTIPVQVINKFQTNAQGQVIRVGETDLVTIQSGALENLVKENNDGRPALPAGASKLATPS